MPLPFERHIPAQGGAHAPVLVLLHGRGGDRFDLLGLRRGFPSDLVIITPQAPFPGAPWGYGGGWAWYRYLGEDRPEPESFDQSQRMLGEFLDELPGRLDFPLGPLVVGGFSQGATMSLAQAIRRPGTVPNVLIFSGFLADHPSVSVSPETVAGTRFFWGHGTADPSIPLSLAESGRRALREAGADLESHDYPIAHSISSAELADASEWIRSVPRG